MFDNFQIILWLVFHYSLRGFYGDWQIEMRYNSVKEMMYMENILVALIIAALLAASTLARDYAA